MSQAEHGRGSNGKPDSNGESNGASQLFDSELERTFVAAVIADPSRLRMLDYFAAADLVDLHARSAFTVVRNLEARGEPVTAGTVRAQLEAQRMFRNPGERINQHPRLGDLVWFDQLAAIAIPADPPIAGWAHQLLDLAVRRAAAIEAAEAHAREEDEITARALDDVEPGPPPRRQLGRTWQDCVAEIYARKDEPWIEILIGQVVIATCRPGSFVPLVAPSGSGKSSLVIQMLVEHALHRGIAVYLTYELDGDEAVARGIGQLCHFGWAPVLHGEVPRAIIPNVERLRVLERDDATLANLAAVVTELRLLHPDVPVLVIADYIQGTPAPLGKERSFVANASVDLRRAAKTNRAVVIGVSQASTENAKKLRDGGLLGIDGSSSGAETAQIERDAYVILTLSRRRVVDPDTLSWMLSIAKYRLGVADVVQELHYRGRTGVWEPIGPPISGQDAREAQATSKDSTKRDELRRAIVALVDASPVAMSKHAIEEQSTGSTALIHDVIKQLVREGLLTHVDVRVRGGARPIWTPRHITDHGSNGES